ncbi:acetyl-CoA C-acyltransferase [Francisella adeliensis]|uniref:acetyl-CoA C-acyltransferase n=1 Tax=Francisella adeliensis TaxID=2007306 RepID=A0A2Z4XWW6_9GAMM|nr:acetyl-CoA C-acyltransferase [Francisella adeliensis]AXA33374.1 acetyl-CoA acetyltransferase [Francisella adeliensis]MBK2085389.1 acetyl-CoA C-acyltransferase [Francisella adeliensis]MBK2097119.1 acetyl-CoA C-acyltransferase [Francisella adeliensis]QIW11602.1 acetyl-CoA C-acyltransferase [Francisella adeliensis]QIW13477.1 acetyl-CoA C-acyltransferase [Francisella adeliensis]
MSENVYIVAAKRSAVTKAKKGGFAKKRPDELLAEILKQTVSESGVNPEDIGDIVVGCAMPEAEQGLNIARISTLLAGLPNKVPAFTINRYCSSGLQSIAIAANEIAQGNMDVAIGAGIESMSMIPMGGNKMSFSKEIFAKDENVAIAYGMGITAENVAKDWNISRQAQDEFALKSHQKAIKAIDNNYFDNEILAIDVDHCLPDENTNKIVNHKQTITKDEGARSDTSLEALAKLKPAFATKGSVTAGNSSQVSDGAGAVILVSESYLKKHNLKPLGKFLGFAVAGVDPRIMGIGPVEAIPKVLKQTCLTIKDMDWIELNEAFAAQSIAVINDLKLDQTKVNPCGGAIALGHPLGATGTILTVKALHGLQRTGKKYGMITMCIGTGMGAAGIIEAC